MASVKLKFRASTMQGKEGILYYQVIHQRKVRQIKTDYRLFSWEWDNQKDGIIQLEAGYSRYTQLQIIRERSGWDIRKLQEVIKGFEAESRAYSTDEVIATFRHSSDNEISFFDYARNEIDKLRLLGNVGTANKRESALNSFMNFRGK